MNYVVAYSGGVVSYIATKRLLEIIPKENITLVFADTKTEDEDLYRFLVETVNFLDIPLVWLADGRDVWQVMNDKKFLGNTIWTWCSKVLKQDLSDAYIKKHFDPATTTLVFGFDWSESERAVRVEKLKAPYACKFPLLDKPFLTYERYFEILKEDRIPAPRLYKYGFTHNNCGGFCVKAGKAHFRRLLKTLPERYLWHEEQEQLLIRRLSSTSKLGLLRHTVDGQKTRLTLKEFREMEEQPGDAEDVGACGCFAE